MDFLLVGISIFLSLRKNPANPSQSFDLLLRESSTYNENTSKSLGFLVDISKVFRYIINKDSGIRVKFQIL